MTHPADPAPTRATTVREASAPPGTADDAAGVLPPNDSRPTMARLSASDKALKVVAERWEPTTDLCCPHPARIRDFLLGGKHSYALERAWCGEQLRIMPSLRRVCHDERAFLLRAVHCAVEEHGIDRILAIGTGLPFTDPVHDLVLSHESGRVVYADNDRCVLAHLDLLADEHPDDVACVAGDFLVPGTILLAEATQSLLADRSPVCMVLVGVLDAIKDTDELTAALRAYTERLPAGSLVIISHATVDGLDPANPADADLAEQMRRVCRAYADVHMPPRYLRTAEELRHILAGLDLVEPGITFTTDWRPITPTNATRHAESLCLAAVAAVPGRTTPRTDGAASGALSRCDG